MNLNLNIIANFIGQAWTALMSMVFVPWYIKYLGMEAYGVIGLFAIIQAWLTILDMGMTPTLSREMARYTAGSHSPHSIRTLLRSLEWIFAGLFLLIFGSLFLSSGYIATSWVKPGSLPAQTLTDAFSVMAAVAALRFVESLYRSAIMGLQRQVLFNVVNSISATLRSAGAVAILALVSPTLKAFFLWHALISLLTLAALMVIPYRAIPSPMEPVRFSKEALKSIAPFAGGIMFTTFLSLLLTQADKIILSRMLSLESFGVYTLSGVVAGVIYYISGPVTQAFTPRLAELSALAEGKGCADNREEQPGRNQLVSAYHLGSQIVVVLTSTASAILVFFGFKLIKLWTGDPALAARAAPIAAIIGTGTFLNCSVHMAYMLQLAQGWSALAAKVNTGAVAILIPSLILLARQFGAIGAAWVWVLLNVGYLLIFVQLMHQRILPGEKKNWYLRDFLVPTLISFGCAALLSRAPLPLGPETGRVVQALAIVLCGGLSCLLSALSAGEVRRLMADQIKKIKNRKNREQK